MINLGTVLSVRTASNRLPGKALLMIDDKPLIKFIYERVKNNKLGGKFFIATTKSETDDYLVSLFKESPVNVFRGSENDLVKRHLDLSEKYNLDFIIRITGDCPFIDGQTLDYCLSQINEFKEFDIFTTKGNFPVGIDFELINCKTLKENYKYMNKSDKEHLTLYFYKESNKKKFKIFKFKPPREWKNSEITYTVDTFDDYIKTLRLLKTLGTVKFTINDLLRINF